GNPNGSRPSHAAPTTSICSSSATADTSGAPSGTPPAGTRIGSRYPAKPYSTCNTNTSQPSHADPTTSIYSSSATTADTSGAPSGVGRRGRRLLIFHHDLRHPPRPRGSTP